MLMKKMRFHGARLSFTLAAVVCAALGLFLLLAPNASRKLLCMLVGAGVLVYGLLHIIPALRKKEQRFYPLSLLIGVCALALGVISLINPTFLMDFLFTALGLIVAVVSVNGVRRALLLRRFGFMRWQAPLIASCVALVLSLTVVFFPGIYGNLLMRLCGALLLTDGICDLLSLHFLARYDAK